MARRKKNIIDITKLNIYPLLLKELKEHPDYADKDLSSLTLTVYDSFEASIKDVDKAITHLKRYVTANKNFIKTFQNEQFISRIQLAKMLGISRQTLTGWINKGFITPLQSKYLKHTETFNTDTVLKELQEYKNAHSEK
ncbi:hypothetical protein [uncultured Dysgonomonas sp.]|uniref:Helix-turn-helix domain-containing protein n=1 Tax=uncultured Dysgonomonas sp. TaxID=206096 RepID=A0A212JUG8_9BACT|nr:hypothetical protein [uncultured Dysgonomonas sp.]SBW03089.1 hypothetical protein KL86DYS1_30484 [uncultured Dysgonomonas sp.]